MPIPAPTSGYSGTNSGSNQPSTGKTNAADNGLYVLGFCLFAIAMSDSFLSPFLFGIAAVGTIYEIQHFRKGT